MSNKIPRLAVIVCGELRTWDRASVYIFKYMKKYAVNVDYFFATWSLSRTHWWPEEKSVLTEFPVTEEDITKPFTRHNENLIGYKLVDRNKLPNYPITIYFQSYLAKVANVIKRRHELSNNFIYDQVIEIRPDLYLRHFTNYPEMISCDDFEYMAGGVYRQSVIGFPQINDFYNRSSSIGNDIICNRFYHDKFNEIRNVIKPLQHWPLNVNNHWVLLNYLNSRQLQSVYDNNNWYEVDGQMPLRVNFPEEDLDGYAIEELRKFDRNWIRAQWK